MIKSTSENPAVLWLRNDLRLADHPALSSAIASKRPLIPLYIFDENAPGEWRMGGASRWWLGQSLAALSDELEKRGSKLIVKRGDTVDVLTKLIKDTGAEEIYCSRAYEPWAAKLEQNVKGAVEKFGATIKRYCGALLREPESLRTKSDEPYKVYTPFWRTLSSGFVPGQLLSAPKTIPAPKKWPVSDKLESWELSPTKPDWAAGMREAWTPGENGARSRLTRFLKNALTDYREQRNRPDIEGTSRLSPHLHFGEISPRTCWVMANHAAAEDYKKEKGLETFLKELVWREFSYSLLHHWPDLPEKPFRPEFKYFPWSKSDQRLRAWQRGQTGFPIVDAGMRELWVTGYMHNRVRMIVASFLIKDLLIPWQQGEAWFWDTLVDADLANNAASWQWVAGSGADAAPYFRIFNPVTQGQKFDPEGDYVRRWVPEVAKLPAEMIHEPWSATELELEAAGVRLGDNYPHPIVDHAIARVRALEAYETVKRSAAE